MAAFSREGRSQELIVLHCRTYLSIRDLIATEQRPPRDCITPSVDRDLAFDTLVFQVLFFIEGIISCVIGLKLNQLGVAAYTTKSRGSGTMRL
jgi:hypothetical protein